MGRPGVARAQAAHDKGAHCCTPLHGSGMVKDVLTYQPTRPINIESKLTGQLRMSVTNELKGIVKRTCKLRRRGGGVVGCYHIPDLESPHHEPYVFVCVRKLA